MRRVYMLVLYSSGWSKNHQYFAIRVMTCVVQHNGAKYSEKLPIRPSWGVSSCLQLVLGRCREAIWYHVFALSSLRCLVPRDIMEGDYSGVIQIW